MTFKPIETQEDFDKAVSERINRERETLNKKFSDYDQLKNQNEKLTKENTSLHSTIKESTEKYANYDKDIEGLNSKISSYETEKLRTKVALENGLPYDLASRLVGDNEEDLKADAERLSGFVKGKEPIAPLKDPEPNPGNNENGAYKNLIENLNMDGE